MTNFELCRYFKQRQKEEYQAFLRRMADKVAQEREFVRASLIKRELGVSASVADVLILYLIKTHQIELERGYEGHYSLHFDGDGMKFIHSKTIKEVEYDKN